MSQGDKDSGDDHHADDYDDDDDDDVESSVMLIYQPALDLSPPFPYASPFEEKGSADFPSLASGPVCLNPHFAAVSQRPLIFITCWRPAPKVHPIGMLYQYAANRPADKDAWVEGTYCSP